MPPQPPQHELRMQVLADLVDNAQILGERWWGEAEEQFALQAGRRAGMAAGPGGRWRAATLPVTRTPRASSKARSRQAA